MLGEAVAGASGALHSSDARAAPQAKDMHVRGCQWLKDLAREGRLRGVGALPPKRQCQAEFQAAVLASMEGLAGRLAAL